MAKRETRIVLAEDARAFIQNMRWFAGVGAIRIEYLADGMASVSARRGTFDQYIWSPKSGTTN